MEDSCSPARLDAESGTRTHGSAASERAEKRCLLGRPSNYLKISYVLLGGSLLLPVLLLVLNLAAVHELLKAALGEAKTLFLELFCWGALGGTLASYLFYARDKDTNEAEAMKQRPDPALLRYPDEIDVRLYGLRILFSGIQGVIAGLILSAGLLYFDANLEGQPQIGHSASSY